jgi:hypothetical protein
LEGHILAHNLKFNQPHIINYTVHHDRKICLG